MGDAKNKNIYRQTKRCLHRNSKTTAYVVHKLRKLLLPIDLTTVEFSHGHVR